MSKRTTILEHDCRYLWWEIGYKGGTTVLPFKHCQRREDVAGFLLERDIVFATLRPLINGKAA